MAANAPKDRVLGQKDPVFALPATEMLQAVSRAFPVWGLAVWVKEMLFVWGPR